MVLNNMVKYQISNMIKYIAGETVEFSDAKEMDDFLWEYVEFVEE